MLINDKKIKKLALEHGMITPFDDSLIRVSEDGTPIISAGLSSFGYDLRAAETFQVFAGAEVTQNMTNFFGATMLEFHPEMEVDPKRVSPNEMRTLKVHTDERGSYVRIPPKTFALCHSIETVKLPPNITALVTSKSTYARAGLQVTTTVGEAGWHGQYVLELFNTLHKFLRVYVNEGIAQILFMEGNEDAEVSYMDRNGKYQNQTGITLPKV